MAGVTPGCRDHRLRYAVLVTDRFVTDRQALVVTGSVTARRAAAGGDPSAGGPLVDTRREGALLDQRVDQATAGHRIVEVVADGVDDPR